MKTPLVSLAALCLATWAAAPLHGIDLGDPAPPLSIATWTKGGAVDLAAGKGKHVYVIEFWATWCGPCRTSIPHLTELQKRLKDQGVIIVGVSNEKPEVVAKFVKDMGEKMEYTVAVDQDRKTGGAYMQAFGVNGIPHAFVVDKAGRLVWHGHPMAGLDQTLEEVLAGRFDVDLAKRRAQAQKRLEDFVRLASTGGDEATLDRLGQELERLDTDLGGLRPGRKFVAAEVRQQIKFSQLAREYQQAYVTEADAAKLERLGQELAAVAPPDFKLAEFEAMLRLGRTQERFRDAATSEGKTDEVAQLAETLVAAKPANASFLNEVAWFYLTDERVKGRDSALGLKLAQAAFDACDGKDASIVDTYARALFDAGKVQEALRQQRRAVDLCEDDGMRPQLAATLKQYELKAAGK